LDLRDTGDAADEWMSSRETQIQNRLLDGRMASQHDCFRGKKHLHVVFQLASRHGETVSNFAVGREHRRGTVGESPLG
jgi:hypothetical protein